MRTFAQQCLGEVYEGAITLAIAGVAFLILERLFLFRRINKPLKSTLLDLQYALLSFLYPPSINFVFAGAFAWIALQGQYSDHNPKITAAACAGEVFVVLLLRDILIYVRHRFFHTQFLWPFHSIHHSSEDVTWLSAVRFHPVEDLIESIAESFLFFACFVFLAVPAKVLTVVSLTIAISNMVVHANLRWTFGPLRYVFVSPVFHRWHHSDSTEAIDKNFAAMFSFLDLFFGTFYMPEGKLPMTTGLCGQEKHYPKGLLGQTLHPFREIITRPMLSDALAILRSSKRTKGMIPSPPKPPSPREQG